MYEYAPLMRSASHRSGEPYCSTLSRRQRAAAIAKLRFRSAASSAMRTRSNLLSSKHMHILIKKVLSVRDASDKTMSDLCKAKRRH